MSPVKISINQIAEFSVASNSNRNRIIKQQINPNKLLIPWYQTAKSTAKKYLWNVNDITILRKGIELLEKKDAKNNRQMIDKKVSIEALNILQTINVPPLLRKIKYEIISVSDKSISLNGVEIKIAPDVIIKGMYKGKIVYGAIKFHVCKSKPFEFKQCEYVGALLKHYLRKKVAKPNEAVLSELCLCLDIFSERYVPSPINSSKRLTELKQLCLELKSLWP
jgi:hypothetical protein